MEDINCLIVRGKGLTDQIRELLYRTARAMFKSGRERRSVRSPDCEALVQTKFGFAIMGSIYGTKFVADVESNNGKTHVEFIVCDRDFSEPIEDGVWEPADIPIPESRHTANSWLN